MAKRKKEYNGCLKSVEKARDYARESFVYGLKTKDELTGEYNVSAHTVENNIRNMGYWFQECLRTRVVKETRKHVRYISLNCREYSANPLYKIWKACSFTTNDIVFFFFILDCLSKRGKKPASLDEIYDEYVVMHRSDGFQKESANWWLENKGIPSGIIVRPERGKYQLAESFDLSGLRELLQYYSEIAPGGVIGSFVLDKLDFVKSPFGFKQHYVGQAFDCEVICDILNAINRDQSVEFEYIPKSNRQLSVKVFPLKVYSGTQNGRQYLIAWDYKKERFFNYRLDRIKGKMSFAEPPQEAEIIRKKFEEVKKHIWGVSLGDGNLVHVEFTVNVDNNEAYIINRLNREKRCGTVTPVENSPGLFSFSADIYDAHEMFPWIRTFTGRIVELKISDGEAEKLFWNSIREMYNMYF